MEGQKEREIKEKEEEIRGTKGAEMRGEGGGSKRKGGADNRGE